jgi:hypothetical protein
MRIAASTSDWAGRPGSASLRCADSPASSSNRSPWIFNVSAIDDTISPK